MTSSGRLHAGSLHPTDVTFADKSQRYDLEAKRLTVDGHQGANITYQRTVTQKRHICPYDVAWRLVVDTAATGQSKTPPALPHELSVDNTKGRVAVFHGPKPKDDEDPKARAADLVACVACTHGQIPSDWSCNRVFELRLHPRLEKQASETPGGLSLILAMIVEGFWSQGAISHGALESDDSHAGEFDQVALLGSEDGKPKASSAVLPAGALLQGYYRRLRKKARKDRRQALSEITVEVA